MFSGDGARALTELIEDINVKVILAEHFNMPNNVCNLPVVKVKNGKELLPKLKKAEKRLKKACLLLYKKKIHLRGFGAFSILLGKTQRPGFMKLEDDNKEKVKVDNNLCIQCGKCVRVCPMYNLSLNEGSIVPKGNCTLCYRCVNQCPKKAITVLIHKKVNAQYKGIPESIIKDFR